MIRFVLCVLTGLTFCGAAIAQEVTTPATPNHFNGLYIVTQGGTQNVFGGSWVNNVDVLAQKSHFVFEVVPGIRAQFLKKRIVVGFELQFGFNNVDLYHEDPAQQLKINYTSNRQHSVGGTLGASIGSRRKVLTFVYLNETTRRFEVVIRENTRFYRQNDEQGMLKYGLGVEVAVAEWLNIRVAAGMLRVDFGGRPTNIRVDDKMDAMVGIVFRPLAPLHLKWQIKD